MMQFDRLRSPRDLVPAIDRMFEISAGKIRSLESSWPREAGAPVFTVNGRYQSRGWTEWTQGFQFGSA
ncbi:MAG: glycosyl hydrolase, partial [Acidobacteria bacterium]|nr:glycosyl hydrolase [Acidobacteriota bacterium]